MSSASVPGPLETHEVPVSGIAGASSFTGLGNLLVAWLRPRLRFDRFNIGLLDWSAFTFTDAYVYGANVPGRLTGHCRTLEGTVVEESIEAGRGIVVSGDPVLLLQRFPRFGPVLDSGIRSMLSEPLYHGDARPGAALVLAAANPDAFDEQALMYVNRLGAAATEQIVRLRDSDDWSFR